MKNSLVLIAPCFKRATAVTVDNPRSMRSGELAEVIKKYCADVTACDNPIQAFNKAKSSLSDGEMLLICGSLYLASEIENG